MSTVNSLGYVDTVTYAGNNATEKAQQQSNDESIFASTIVTNNNPYDCITTSSSSSEAEGGGSEDDGWHPFKSAGKAIYNASPIGMTVNSFKHVGDACKKIGNGDILGGVWGLATAGIKGAWDSIKGTWDGLIGIFGF